MKFLKSTKVGTPKKRPSKLHTFNNISNLFANISYVNLQKIKGDTQLPENLLSLIKVTLAREI